MGLSGGEESPQKRKRSMDDLGERETKKVHIEERRLEFEDLHLNVGPKYLLCKTRKALLPNLANLLPQRRCRWPSHHL